MNIFHKMRDAAFRFIEREGDFSLHFFADFIRGPSAVEEKKKTKQAKAEKPLTHDEQQVFNELLQRRKGEDQIAYWKRKKAMLNMADKKSVVQEEIAARKQRNRSTKQEYLIETERERRKLQMQMQRIKTAKYDSIQQKNSPTENGK